nr:hypothetical protein [Actinomycetota bacterium]
MDVELMHPLRLIRAIALLSFVVAACGDDGRPSGMDGAVFRPDEDGDTIANQDEGSSASVDTDGDGTQDWQ